MNELRTHLFDARGATPSIETLVHAFLPGQVRRPHARRRDPRAHQPGRRRALVREALGDDDRGPRYVGRASSSRRPSAAAYEAHPGARGMVLDAPRPHHVGRAARASYEAHDRAGDARRGVPRRGGAAAPRRGLRARRRSRRRGARAPRGRPRLRGALARPTGDADRPDRRVVVRPLVTPTCSRFVDGERGRELRCTPPLTTDHLIRTKALPLWIDAPALGRPGAAGASRCARRVRRYAARRTRRTSSATARLARRRRPRSIRCRAWCCCRAWARSAPAPDARAATIARDITAQTLAVKAAGGRDGHLRRPARSASCSTWSTTASSTRSSGAGEAAARRPGGHRHRRRRRDRLRHRRGAARGRAATSR